MSPAQQGKEKPREIEAKFGASVGVFRKVAGLEEIAGWRVVERRSVRLRDAYWDTPDHRLGREECTLRVREMDAEPVGELTFKGKPEGGGRTEETAAVRTRSGPAQWRRVAEAREIVGALRELGVLGRLRQDIVLLNPRRELVLRKGRAEEVLSLDEVRIEGYPYTRRYVEVEQKAGSREGHDALARALAECFGLKESKTGKVQAAREWLARRRDDSGG